MMRFLFIAACIAASFLSASIHVTGQLQMPADKPKVLVSDDERVIADVLTLILNRHGYDASAVYSGNDAVEQAKTLQPDYFISGDSHYNMEGIEAAIRIHEILPTCKIMCLTLPSMLEASIAKRKGLDFDIFVKAIHPQDLLAWLESNLEGAVKPIAVPYVEPIPNVPLALPVRIEAPAKAVTPAKAKPTLTGAMFGYLLKFACFVLVLMAVFAALAFVGYGLDQLIARTPHVKPQHYIEPIPEPHNDGRFRLLKS